MPKARTEIAARDCIVKDWPPPSAYSETRLGYNPKTVQRKWLELEKKEIEKQIFSSFNKKSCLQRNGKFSYLI